MRRIHIIDLLVILVMIIFYRGVWGLLDLFVFPHNLLLSSIVCIVFSLCACLIFIHYKIIRTDQELIG